MNAAPQVLEPRSVPLGGVRAITVRRTLPHRGVRTIGAWCFVDHYGPQDVASTGAGAMQVPPHPHTGLQTVTWLLEGEVEHDDSLGSHQLIRPGELNLMTAGSGIAHAEQSPTGRAGRLHGVQLWVALPEATRHQPAHFEHHADLPSGRIGGAAVTVLLGEIAGARSPAQTYTPILAAVLQLPAGARTPVPLDPSFEHGVLGLDGDLEVDDAAASRGSLVGLAAGRRSADLTSRNSTRVLLLGGEPFTEDLVMWWNFVGRSHEEVVQARSDWAAGRRFGAVHYDGEPLPAPAMPTTRLLPRRSRGLDATT